MEAIRDRLAVVTEQPAAAAVRRFWTSRPAGTAVQLVLSVVAGAMAWLVVNRPHALPPSGLAVLAVGAAVLAMTATKAARPVAAGATLILGLEYFLRHHPVPPGVVVFGAIVGLLYAIIAFGLILIHRANRVINFAQAEMGAAPAVLAAILIKVHHFPYLVALLIAIVAALFTGFTVETAVVRRFFRAPRLVLSVVTIGVALLLALLQFELPHWLHAKQVDPQPPKTPFSHIRWTIRPVRFDGNSLIILIAAALVVIGLTAFFRYTDIGIAVRASAENGDRATLLGISVKRLSTYVWMIAALLSTIGVFLRIPVIGLPIGADIGPQVLLYALAAAVIARMESFPAALGAGVAIGVLEQSLYFFSRDPSIASALMLPVLLFAMLAQRGKLSRGQDTGMSSFKQATEFRPIPPELRNVPILLWGRVAVGAVVVAFALGLPYIVGLQQQILSSLIVIYGIVAISLVILTGWAGQISLGQWGFAGIGSLVAGGLAAHLHWDFWITLVCAGLAGAVVSLIIGLPALRIQGLYLAVTTLAFALMVQVYLLSPNYFRRFLPTNLQTIQRPLLYGRYSIDGPRAFYYLTLLFLVLCLLSARAVRKSRAGRVMVAARDNERGAQSYGVSVARARIAAFAISGFWAALAGGLFAYQQKVVEPASFDPQISFLILIFVVIGGVTSLPGALLGVFYYGALRYGGTSPQVQTLASSVGVLILLYAMPGGLAQAMYGARDAVLRAVANRLGIVVPSLVADVRTPGGAGVTAGAEELEQAAELLATAPALVEPEETDAGFAHLGEVRPELVVCPVCEQAVPIDDLREHEHFKVVTA